METYRQIGLFWVVAPLVAGLIAYGTARLLRDDRVSESLGVPILAAVVGAVLANVRLAFVPGSNPAGGTLAGFISRQVGGGPSLAAGVDAATVLGTLLVAAAVFVWLRREMAVEVDRGIRRFLVGLGALVAFSSGGSQVGLATGPLETLFETQLELPGITLLGLGGVGILLGAWMGSPRLLQAVSREYSQLGVRRSIAALVPGFLIAQAAIALGIPISFNQIIIASVVGSGLAAGTGGVSGRKIGVTVAAWVVTLVVAVVAGYALYSGLALVVGG